MQGVVENISERTLQLRIGIHTGEVVAGVIGKRKFSYDLWGDTVNTASRMESHGEAGKIHVSQEVKEKFESGSVKNMEKYNTKSANKEISNQADNIFYFSERGEIQVKGKGQMKTFFVAVNVV